MEKEKTYLAKISVWFGGKYGRMGEYIAEIKPKFFKNGNMKKSDFTVVKEVETIKEGYRACISATKTETIKEIIKEL